MSRPPRPAEILLTVERGSGRPLRAQLESGLRQAIRSGALRRGDALPPSRHLARDLSVARGVVVEAYGQLVAEGWLDARPGRGTRVARVDAGDAPTTPSAYAAEVRFDFRPGVPDVTAFPRDEWLRALAFAVKRSPASRLLYPPPAGLDELRTELASYLGRVRGAIATPECIVVCAGVSQALHLLGEELRADGRQPALEDPGHFEERRLLQDRGLSPVAVPVDDEGLDAGALAESRAQVALVTPAHQFPLGIVMSPARRAALARWVGTGDHLLVEDDYDAEFRYDRHPVGALQGLAPDRVVYLGSVSKTLAPGLRLGWILAPYDLAARLAQRKWLNDLGTPALDQLAFARFLESGAYDRHIRRMRQRYRERRNALVDALKRHAPGVRVHGAAAGIHLIVELPPGLAENDVVRAAAARSVRVLGLRPFTFATARSPSLVLGYATLTPSAIEAATAELAAAIGDARP